MNGAQLDFERQWGDRPHNEAYFDGLAEREDVTFSTVEVTPTNGGKPVLVLSLVLRVPDCVQLCNRRPSWPTSRTSSHD